MKYYIATKLERASEHNAVRDAMAARGHTLTYDWTTHGPVWRSGIEKIREVAWLEAKGVLDADVVIVLLPGGRGTHAELGLALAADKPVILHAYDSRLFEATPETCAFYHHPLCCHAVTNDPRDVVKWPESWGAAHIMSRRGPCPTCRGVGVHSGQFCETCAGQGFVGGP